MSILSFKVYDQLSVCCFVYSQNGNIQLYSQSYATLLSKLFIFFLYFEFQNTFCLFTKHFGGDGKQYQYQQNKQPPFTEVMENQVLASHKYSQFCPLKFAIS
jgi:hypothetical protein